MTSLLVALILVYLVPLVLASWRTSVAGLALQGLLLAGMVLEQVRPPSLSVVLLLFDLAIVRGFVVPFGLRRIQLQRPAGRSGSDDVLPANLVTWTLAGVILLISFRFARLIGGETPLTGSLVAVATVGFLLGLLILATQSSPFSQVVGFLRIENAIVLLELASPETPPLPVQCGLLVVYLLTVGTFLVLLRRFDCPDFDHPDFDHPDLLVAGEAEPVALHSVEPPIP